MQAINILAPNSIDPADSYPIIAIELAKSLQREQGMYVNLLSLGPRNCPGQDAETAAIVAQPVKPAQGGIFLGWPTGYAKHPAQTQEGQRVAVTMFESTRLPSGWAQTLSDMDAVIVPSTFCRDVFKDCGVTAPITVAPLGVSCTYKPAQRPPSRPLTFLAFLDRGARKGGLVALHAFLKAFGDDMNYRLILKGRTPKVSFNLTNPNIEVIQRDMSEAELYELFCSADVLIDANKGEGFGMIGRQFSATGGISISTAWGGTADDIGLWGIRLPYTLVPADWKGSSAGSLEGQDLGSWAEPDLNALVATLHRIADNRLFYQARAYGRAGEVGRKYTWRKFAERVLEVWEEANGNSPGL